MKTKKNFFRKMLAIIVICLSLKTMSYGQIFTDTISVGDTVKMSVPYGDYNYYLNIPNNVESSSIYLKIDISNATGFFWPEVCSTNCDTNLMQINHGSNNYYCGYQDNGEQLISYSIYYIPTIEDITMNYGDTTLDMSHYYQCLWYNEAGEEILNNLSATLSAGTYNILTNDHGGYTGLDTFNITCINNPYTLLGTTTLCYGGTSEITLDASEDSTYYVLYKDSSEIDTLQGNGSALSFGFWPAGIYTCKGFGTLGETWMNDSVIIDEYPILDPNFTNTSTDLNVSFLPTQTSNLMYWEFGDGVTSNDSTPSHDYFSAGYYDVCLTLIDTLTGCQAVKLCKSITVSTPIEDCQADFIVSTAKSNGMSFIDKSKGFPNKWHWKFGDGKTDTSQHPTHVYEVAGTYEVILTITNETNQCIADCDTIIVIAGGINCEADFTYSVNNANQKVNFVGSANIDNIDSWEWDFGDGTSATNQSLTHKYSEDGYYSVCLKITTDDGKTDIICKDIQVGSANCKADFSWRITDYVNHTVQFTDKTIGIPNDWKWNFGDGGHAEIASPIYSYNENGLYHVHYMIKGGACHPSHKNDVVNLGEDRKPQGTFGYYQDSSANKSINTTIEFFGGFWGTMSSWNWDFGDGTTENIQLNPKHIYSEPGEYTACLSYKNPDLGIDSVYCQVVRVNGLTINSENKIQNSELKIYPNPSNDGEIQITTNEKIRNVKVINVLGDILQETPNTLINITQPGIYLLVIQTDKENFTRKVIIN